MEETAILNVTHTFFSAKAEDMDRRAASVDPRASHTDDHDHRAGRSASVMPSRDMSQGRAYLGLDSFFAEARSQSTSAFSRGQSQPPSLSRIASSAELAEMAEAEHLPLPSVIGREWGPAPAYEVVPSMPGSPEVGFAADSSEVDSLDLSSLQAQSRRAASAPGQRLRTDRSPAPGRSPLGPSRMASHRGDSMSPLDRVESGASTNSSVSRNSTASANESESPSGVSPHSSSRPPSISERGRSNRLLPHLQIDSSAGPSTAVSSEAHSPAGSIHSPRRSVSALPSAMRQSGSQPPASRSASKARFSLAGLGDALRGKSVSRSRTREDSGESRGRSRDTSPDTVRDSRASSRGRKTALKSLRQALSGPTDEVEEEGGADKVVSHGWKEFRAGTYTYPISLSIPGSLPPSIVSDFGFVSYSLKATVVRSGALTANLSSSTEVLLVSAPGTEDTEESESIVVERFWESQMKYHVALSGKSFPIGGRIPLTIRLSPMAKVKLYRITASLEQKTTYFALGRKLTRHETPKKFPLLRVDFKDGSPLLPILDGQANEEHPLKDWFAVGGDQVEGERGVGCLDPLGPWQLESFIPLPDCSTRVGFSTNHEKANISVSHVVKVTLRVERGDDDFLDSKGKRKLWDVIIEAPVHLLSCRCTATILPPYTSPDSGDNSPSVHGSAAAGGSTPFTQPPDCGAHGTPGGGHHSARAVTPLHLTAQPPTRAPSPGRVHDPPTTSIDQTLLFERLVSGQVGTGGEVPPTYREVAVDEEDEGRGRAETRQL